MKIPFSPLLPVFRKTIALWKVLRLRSLIDLVRATFRFGWISSICGMILWGANQRRSTLRKLSQCHFVFLRIAWIYIQWNFLGQTAASRCEVVPKFRQLTPSPSSGCADGFVVAETSENLHILALLSAREMFIEFCRRESFKTYMNVHCIQKCSSHSYWT